MSHVQSTGGPRRTRAEWYATVKPMRDEGLTGLEIARRTGLSSTFVYELLGDPDGSKARARKDRNRKPCRECGAPTTPETLVTRLCRGCYNAAREAPHGTASRYRSSGCRCPACTTAATEEHRKLLKREPPNHGTESGYANYGCRCPACTEAHRKHEWLRYPAKKRYRKAAA